MAAPAITILVSLDSWVLWQSSMVHSYWCAVRSNADENVLKTSMPLIKGHRYTWSEIVDETGADGLPPYYLLHRSREVVAGCFTLELNPEAPLVVLAGKGPQIIEWTDVFCTQKGSIPVCLKSGLGEWLCCGNFKLARSSTDPAEIAKHSAIAGRSDVYKILFLQELVT